MTSIEELASLIDGKCVVVEEKTGKSVTVDQDRVPVVIDPDSSSADKFVRPLGAFVRVHKPGDVVVIERLTITSSDVYSVIKMIYPNKADSNKADPNNVSSEVLSYLLTAAQSIQAITSQTS